jgi:tRNA threonylcarbamoyladenosine biosynthesis protein TsaE
MFFSFVANDETDTDRLGAALADALPDGSAVALLGTLGAGKTRLVRAVAAACGIPPDDVVSPTFVLCQTYRGRRTLHHFDAYRIKDDDEFLELGPDEYFESDALTFVEWADRVAECLPQQKVEISIEVIGPSARRFLIQASAGLAAFLRMLADRLEAGKAEDAG